MINLRYHIVSIVAVFLALGIGLALGSTFVDSVLVSNLERQVDQLEADSDAAVSERNEAVAALDVVVQERQAFEEVAEGVISHGRLGGLRVVMIVPDTVDRTQVVRVRDSLVASNAEFGGVLWLTTSFDLDDGTVRAALAEELRLAGSGVGVVGRALNFLITQALFAPEEAGDLESQGPRVLTTLRDAGLVVYDPSFGGRQLERVGRDDLVVVVLTDADAQGINTSLLLPLFEEFVASGYGGRVLVAEVGSGVEETAAESAAFVDTVRASASLAPGVSTVDSIEDYEGLVALVTTLGDLPRVGHHGRRASAESRFPG